MAVDADRHYGLLHAADKLDPHPHQPIQPQVPHRQSNHHHHCYTTSPLHRLSLRTNLRVLDPQIMEKLYLHDILDNLHNSLVHNGGRQFLRPLPLRRLSNIPRLRFRQRLYILHPVHVHHHQGRSLKNVEHKEKRRDLVTPRCAFSRHHRCGGCRFGCGVQYLLR